MRKVEFISDKEFGPGYIPKKLIGDFHQWGTDVFYDGENRPHTITVAIVEDNNGKIYKIDPEDITFVG